MADTVCNSPCNFKVAFIRWNLDLLTLIGLIDDRLTFRVLLATVAYMCQVYDIKKLNYSTTVAYVITY